MKRSRAVRPILFLLLGLLSASSIASCASSEQVILITARAAGTNPTVIDTVVVRVIPTASTAAPVNSESNPVHRTVQDINADQPIRVAVHLHDPTPVLIHITAITASGATMLYATRCYAPNGVLRDEVLLVPLDVADDADGDGWPDAAHVDASCRDPGPGSTGVACDIGMCTAIEAGDCNDTPATTTPVNCALPAFQDTGPCIFPGAPAVCGDGIDQDCRDNGLAGGSLDEPCGDMDGDGVNACGPAGGVCDCNDNDANIHPGADDVCGNGIDEDCSGEAGGMGAFCDADGDTYPSNVDCNDDDPNVHPGGLDLEHCDASPTGGMCGVACTNDGGTCVCDGVDNNCNGLTDEDASCQSPDLDGDGSDACAAGATDCGSCDCNDCDSGIHPGATDHCGDGIDEDGIGGDMACAAGDTDRDGFIGGQDCAEGDARVHLDAAENCLTATSESCNTMTCPASVDADADGFEASSVGGTDCDDSTTTGMSINPWATEVCNGVDDNCNGDADEVLDPTNQIGCVTDPTCPGGSRCEVHFVDNIHHCGGCRQECNPGTTLVANTCASGACSCTTNPGGAACAVGSTCCDLDSMGNAVAFPGCFDTNTATQNCGGCGNVCDPTTADSCVAGRCECGATGAACTAGQTCCGGQCVDLATDVDHCGSCTRACGARTACTGGTCGCDDATAHGDCNGDLGAAGGNGCETDLLTDATHCGTCAQSCLDEHVATGTCSGGACTIGSCQPLFGDCTGGAANGCETSLSTTSNCGGCGTSCAPMHADAQCIVAGTTASCGYGTCMSTFGNCDSNVVNGCETSLRATSTCGACGTNCTSLVQNASATCSGSGTCDYTGSCSAGTSDCNGSRVDGCEPFATTHCGASCTNCSSTILNATGPSCSGGGTCDYASCSGTFADCDTNRTNGCETSLRATATCGACGTNCTSLIMNASGPTCSAGGTCDYGSCSGTFGDCDTNRTNGCETSLRATATCGTCGTNCGTTIQHATGATCTAGGTCDYTACSGAFAECNGTRADGCERAWDATHCGAGCANCSTMTVNATGQTCTAGGTCDYSACSGTNFDCNGNRADGCEQPQNVTHCGGCSTNCNTLVTNVATVTCSSGTCGYSGGCTGNACDADGMTNNGCEGTQSLAACGPTCALDCTLSGGDHATGSCTGGACGIASCNSGFANCDGTISNGCEMMTAGTAADCCGATCSGGTPNCRGTATGGFMCGT